ncbi:hypothetical protein [Variovorax sp. JS1663]|uniref:hypothetical protein n=1 Tax=Variovorax sp. JS1663 TaxID=1851577 RepID=UPI000B3415B9|nr:hypothetical protein [Variovorax sp. JS1663]OUL99729.1 hypothetical protein A8M77_24875 [Variovorax sp. JS1663]
MDAILLLIAISFLSVPFLQESEAQGARLRRFPDLPQILRLAHVRRCGWLGPFCGLTLFLFILVLARGRAAAVDGLVLALHAAIIQCVLWTVVVLNVRRRARAPNGQGVALGTAACADVQSLLHRS